MNSLVSGLNFSKELAFGLNETCQAMQLNHLNLPINNIGKVILATPFYQSATSNIFNFISRQLGFDKGNEDSCENRIKLAIEQIVSCPDSLKLWTSVQKDGPITIKCNEDDSQFGKMPQVLTEVREILLPKNSIINQMIPDLIFELNNLQQAKSINSQIQSKCQLERDVYALGTEKIEYETAKKTHMICKSCIQSALWPTECIKYQAEFKGEDTIDWSTFEGYLATQEESGHTDLYRMDWYKKCHPEKLNNWLADNMPKWDAVLKKINAKKDL